MHSTNVLKMIRLIPVWVTYVCLQFFFCCWFCFLCPLVFAAYLQTHKKVQIASVLGIRSGIAERCRNALTHWKLFIPIPVKRNCHHPQGVERMLGAAGKSTQLQVSLPAWGLETFTIVFIISKMDLKLVKKQQSPCTAGPCQAAQMTVKNKQKTPQMYYISSLFVICGWKLFCYGKVTGFSLLHVSVTDSTHFTMLSQSPNPNIKPKSWQNELKMQTYLESFFAMGKMPSEDSTQDPMPKKTKQGAFQRKHQETSLKYEFISTGECLKLSPLCTIYWEGSPMSPWSLQNWFTTKSKCLDSITLGG